MQRALSIGRSGDRATWSFARATNRLIVSGLVVALAALAGAWAAWIVWGPPGIGAADLIWSTVWVSFAVLGALIAQHPSGTRVGALFVFAGALVLVATLLDVASAHLTASGEVGDLSAWMRWLQNLLYLPALVAAVPLALLRFPTGNLVDQRLRIAEFATITAAVLVTLGDALQPGIIGDHGQVANPAAWRAGAAVTAALGGVGRPIVALGVVVAVASLVVRWRRARHGERRQVLWLVWGAGAGVLALLVREAFALAGAHANGTTSALIAAAIVVVLPASVAIAVVREGLYDVELLIRRSVVLAVTAVALGTGYVAAVLVVSAVTSAGRTAVSLLATVVAALLALPVRAAATRAVDRRLFGYRSEPYRALSSLIACARHVPEPAQALQEMAEGAIRALRLSGIRIEDTGARTLAAAGREPGPHADRVPLVYQDRAVGVLIAGRRSADESLVRWELDLLAEIGGPIAAGVCALELAADVQRAGERVIYAAEEERRRLRRDLHDGIGPTLAAMSLHLGLAREGAQPETAARLREVDRLLEQASGDLRRTVQGLRPPALDDLGLAGALREQLATLGDRLDTKLVVGDLGTVPAAVEAAIYRIVSEALTNVVRHAAASSVEVTLKAETVARRAGVRAIVLDDGIGIGGTGAGVGRRSMVERAAELGGVVAIAPGGERGTVISTWLPA
jgi:signal transduction histidine kinase